VLNQAVIIFIYKADAHLQKLSK